MAMKKFMLLYMAPVSAESQMDMSPEEMQKGMEPWMAWFGKYGDAIVDGGAPLGSGMHVTPSGSSERKTQVAGYSIVQAEDDASVQAMVAEHPHFMMPEGSIEVLEVFPMPM
jgi:hypothetical protein